MDGDDLEKLIPLLKEEFGTQTGDFKNSVLDAISNVVEKNGLAITRYDAADLFEFFIQELIDEVHAEVIDSFAPFERGSFKKK